jgi:hypothetical protein
MGVVAISSVGGTFVSRPWNVGLRLSPSAETRSGFASGIESAEHCCRPEHVGSVHSLVFFVPKDAQNSVFKTPFPHLRDLYFDFSALSCSVDLVALAVHGVAGGV